VNIRQAGLCFDRYFLSFSSFFHLLFFWKLITFTLAVGMYQLMIHNDHDFISAATIGWTFWEVSQKSPLILVFQRLHLDAKIVAGL
jgi:hypothetical protein